MTLDLRFFVVVGLIWRIGASQDGASTTYDPILLENKGFCIFCPAIATWIRSVMWDDPVKSQQEQYIFDVIYEEQCKFYPEKPNHPETKQSCVTTTQQLLKDHLADLRQDDLFGGAKWACFKWYEDKAKACRGIHKYH